MTNPAPVPARPSMQNLESFVESFLWSYALHTQVKPAQTNTIVDGLYNGVSDARELRRAQTPDTGLAAFDDALGDVVQKCLEEGGYGLVLRDEKGNQSLVMRSLMPTADIPTGDVMDLPLDAYLRSRGVAAGFATRVHNVLVRQLSDSDKLSFCMRLVTNRHLYGPGDRYSYSSVLTVGGLVAYLRKHSLEELYGQYGVGAGTVEVLTEHVIKGAMGGVSQGYRG